MVDAFELCPASRSALNDFCHNDERIIGHVTEHHTLTRWQETDDTKVVVTTAAGVARP